MAMGPSHSMRKKERQAMTSAEGATQAGDVLGDALAVGGGGDGVVLVPEEAGEGGGDGAPAM